MNYIRLLLAFVVPPLAIYLQFGIGKHFWVNCVLTLFGIIPGMLHAIYMMAARAPVSRASLKQSFSLHARTESRNNLRASGCVL